MPRFARKAWFAFGSLLSLSSHPNQNLHTVMLARTRNDLKKRSDREMLASDFERVGGYIQHAMEQYRV